MKILPTQLSKRDQHLLALALLFAFVPTALLIVSLACPLGHEVLACLCMISFVFPLIGVIMTSLDIGQKLAMFAMFLIVWFCNFAVFGIFFEPPCRCPVGGAVYELQEESPTRKDSTAPSEGSPLDVQ